MIDDIRAITGHGVRRICDVLGVPRSSYYHAASPTVTELSDRDVGERIEEIFKRHRRRYGYRRIWRDLADAGVTCAPARVRRIMAQRGLKAIQPKTYVPRTSDGRADKPSPNLLAGKALPDRPDRVWAGDITFVPTSAGWLYLAVVIDLCTRRIVGWSLARHMRAGLVADALKQALWRATARSPAGAGLPRAGACGIPLPPRAGPPPSSAPPCPASRSSASRCPSPRASYAARSR